MKKIFKNKFLRMIFFGLGTGVLIWQSGFYRNFFRSALTAEAVGDLTVDWGVPDGQPIFAVANMLPGDLESRTVLVQNDASTLRPVAVRAEKTEELKDFSQTLEISIVENNTLIYGPEKLADFFAASSGFEGIPLSLVGSGQAVDYTFKVFFPDDATNNYQEAKVVFDLLIGIAFEIPEECQWIKFNKPPIFGTENRDVLNGTNGNEIIFGFEGNDKINGTNGDDCLVGGLGNDRIRGTNGQDVLFGNEGDDWLDGGNGDDLIYGGVGNDTFFGTNGQDKMYGGEGDDVFHGTNGNDYMEGGSGDDRFDGSNGNDYVQGGEGNDIMKGGNGNDQLLGGSGQDEANGGIGGDHCEAEKAIKCES